MSRLGKLTLVVAAWGLTQTAVGHAALPSAAHSTCPSLIRLVGSSVNGPDVTDGMFQVIVHDSNDDPIDQCRVTVSFCEARDLRIAPNQMNPDYTVDCQAATVSALTDAQGVVVFTLLGGSTGLANASSKRGSVKIFADDPATTEVESVLLSDASPSTGLSCSAPDLDGAGGLGVTDISILLQDTQVPPASGCWQRSDFDGNGVVEGQAGGVDRDVLLGIYFSARMTMSPVAYCAPCPPPPTLVSIHPAFCGNIAPIAVTLNGTNFVNGATAVLELAGQASVVGSVTFVNSTTLQVTFDITGIALGAWDVRITNPNGATALLTGGFTIMDALQAVTPTISENIGTILLTVTGCGFQPGATIRLSRLGEPSDIVGTSTVVVSTNEANALFDVDGRTVGLWDVTVTNTNGESSTIQQGFELQAPQPGDLVLAVIGNNTKVKPNTKPRVRLEVSQTGNAEWKGYAFLALTVSGNVGVARLRMLGCCPGTITDLSLFPDGPDQLTSLVMLPNVPVGPALGYELELRPPGTTWTVGEEVRVCARLYSAREDLHDLGAILRESVRALGNRLAPGNEPSLGAVFETAFHTALGTALSNWVTAFSTAYASNAGLTVLAEVRSSTFLIECVEDALATLASTGFAADVTSYRTSFWNDVRDVQTLDPDCSDGTDPRCFESGQEGDAVAIALPPKPAQHWPDAPASCWTMPVVSSSDPNAKTGPSGTTSTHVLNHRQPLTYRVGFENVPTATAPAQDVVITDQLDVAHLDLSTFEWSTTTIGERAYFSPPGLKTTQREVDLRPDRDVLVRITQHLNMTTGLLTCTFRSIDPATGLTPANPLSGFLPANLNPPEGEGSISYRVRPRTSVTSGTIVANQARIVFDQNPYLDTPVWTNLFDFDAPSSHVLPLAATQGNTSFTVSWTGTDPISGVLDYSVFVSTDAGPYQAWRRNTLLTSDTFAGQAQQSYAFYSVARDSAGNLEAAPSTPDATTTVTVGVESTAFALAFAGAMPNPARNGELALTFTLPDREPATIELLDIAGRSFIRQAVGHLGPGPHTWTLARGQPLAPGLYHVRLAHGGLVLTRKVVVLR